MCASQIGCDRQRVNAEIEDEKVYRQVTGKFIIHENISSNGEMFINMKIEMIVVPFFPYKLINKITWLSPKETSLINQIDRVLVNKRRHTLVEDVISTSGLNSYSDL